MSRTRIIIRKDLLSSYHKLPGILENVRQVPLDPNESYHIIRIQFLPNEKRGEWRGSHQFSDSKSGKSLF